MVDHNSVVDGWACQGFLHFDVQKFDFSFLICLISVPRLQEVQIISVLSLLRWNGRSGWGHLAEAVDLQRGDLVSVIVIDSVFKDRDGSVVNRSVSERVLNFNGDVQPLNISLSQISVIISVFFFNFVHLNLSVLLN